MSKMQAVHHAIRAILREPGFSLVIAGTSALGIATATAVFSLVYAVLLRPYPYQDPHRLVRVQSRYLEQEGHVRGLSLLDIEDYRRRAESIEDIGAYTAFETQIVGDGPGQATTIAQANPAALNILGVRPAIGRLLLPDAHQLRPVANHLRWRSGDSRQSCADRSTCVHDRRRDAARIRVPEQDVHLDADGKLLRDADRRSRH
jgi:MacB-like periplasmic core domain